MNVKAIIVLLMSVVPMMSYGQFDINKAIQALKQTKSETSVVELSVLPELSIVRQQYRLARDGNTYGKNNKPYYGENYSLAIKVSNGLILSSTVVEPWNMDEDFNRLNTSNQYKPELFWTYQRPLDDASYHEVDFEFGTDYMHPIGSCELLYVHEERKGDFGLPIDSSPGEKDGYMVWVYTGTSLQDSAMSVSVKLEPKRIVASEDGERMILDAGDFSKVLGGLYVVPRYERGGRIQMQVVGVAVPVSRERKWELFLFAIGTDEKRAVSQTKIGDGEGYEPTPIVSKKEQSGKNGKKNRK